MLDFRRKRARFVRATCVGLVSVIAMTGCGGSDNDADQAVADTPAVSTEAPADPLAGGAVDPGAIPGATAAPTVPGDVTNPGAAASAVASAATGGGGKQGGKDNKAGSGSGAKPAAGGSVASQPCKQQLAPIVLGQVGTFSGLVGQSVGGMKPGLAVWAQAVNARGGVQCHPVQVIAVDDQNDPQKAAAGAEDLIVNKKAVAIVGANVPLTISGLVRTVNKYKIPVIGGDGIDGGWQENQYLFPQGGTPLSAFGGALAAAKKDKGFDKTFLLYCAEAAICTLTNSSAKAKGGIAELAGVQLLGSQQVTLTQPDYTAACQNAKASGAQFLFVLVDAAAMRRVARSCNSIGFKVPIAGTAIDFTAESPKDPNLSAVGVYASAPVAAFPAMDTPALKLFHESFAKYIPGAGPDQSTIEGWTAGVLFEKTLAAVADKARAGNVTTEMIYEGLYKLKDETVDGMGPGVTFRKGGLPLLKPCYYVLTIKDGAYRAPFGSERFCFARDPAKA